MLICRRRRSGPPSWRGGSWSRSSRRTAIAEAERTHVSRAMSHVRHLAETIGPRGSTSAQEREASEYVRGVLDGLGLSPRVQPFTSAVSAWRPYALAGAPAIPPVAAHPIGGRVTAAIAPGLVGGGLGAALF